MKYIIHDAAGNIARIVHCPEDHIELQVKEGQIAIADKWGDTHDTKHKIINGERVEFTPPPPPLPIIAQRARAYRPIQDQLDALWHAMDKGILPMVPAFYDPNAEVKNKYPKGGK